MKNRLNKSVLIILSTVLFFLFSYATAQKEQIESMDAATYNNRGLTYMKKGQYDRAIPDFSKAIEMDSRYARAYYNRGIAYGKKDQYDRAISDFTKAIEIDPKYAAAYNHRGMTYMRKNLYDQAIADLTKAIEIDSRYAEDYNNRGMAYVKKSQYDQAIADFTKAIKINPRLAAAYTNRGITYVRKDQYDRAISDYTKAIEINPKYVGAYSNRGVAYGKKGQYDLAISDHTKALEIDPKYAAAYYNRGMTYVEKGQYGLAISDFTKAIAAVARYTQYAIMLHWLTVLLIIVTFPLGVYVHGLAFSPFKLQLVSYHKWIGVSILLLTVLRLAWRVLHKPPPLPETIPVWQQRAAHGLHHLLYLLLLAIPVSGWLMSSAKGVPVVYFGLMQLPDLVGKNKELGDMLQEIHEVLNIGMLVLVIMHVAAALKHQFIDKDWR